MTYTLRYWLSASRRNQHLISPTASPRQLIIIGNQCSLWLPQITGTDAEEPRRTTAGKRKVTVSGGALMRRRAGRGGGFREKRRMQFKRLAFNLVYVAEVAQLSLKGTVCVHWHRWGVVALHKQYQVQNASCSWCTVAKTGQYNLSTNSSATMFRKVTCQCMELFQILFCSSKGWLWVTDNYCILTTRHTIHWKSIALENVQKEANSNWLSPIGKFSHLLEVVWVFVLLQLKCKMLYWNGFASLLF